MSVCDAFRGCVFVMRSIIASPPSFSFGGKYKNCLSSACTLSFSRCPLPSFHRCFSSKTVGDEGRGVNATAEDFRRVRHFAVMGAGQMGTGIALTAAHRMTLESAPSENEDTDMKCIVSLLDVSEAQLSKSHKFVESWLAKERRKQRLTEAQSAKILANLQFIPFSHDNDGKKHVNVSSGNSPSHFSWPSVDFVVEAASEHTDLKLGIFKQLDALTRPDVILASNTSSISITKIAGVTSRPANVIGMHFMNPVPVMPLVEIVSGLLTSTDTVKATLTLATRMGKVTAKSADRPGFVANRILMPYINEAIFALQDGLATKEDIDQIMKLGTNVPMGPLTLADFIGLDTCFSILKVLNKELGEDKYRPAPLLTQYVEAGLLGKKVGRGFYEYN